MARFVRSAPSSLGGSMNRYFKTFALAALALCVVKPASANFLYDVSASDVGGIAVHYTFLESSILTSATTVSTFLSNPNGVTSVVLGPDSGDNCGFVGAPGPCISTTRPLVGGSVTALSYFAVAFESVGTFTGNNAILTITEVAAVPEPAT